ncbi:MAG: tripartite tricarboxylate transporter TctB family protein [Woeseiaceae bacterium]|nr:tripartite tricarboxylate transporter TctB family protein [Woeseiaceae bacterium]
MHEPATNGARRQIADIAVVALLGLLTGLYLWDAVRASTAFLHLILVAPLAVLILALCLLVLVRTLATRPAADAGAGGAPRDEAAGALIAIGLFTAFVAALPWLGFDGATFLFIAAFLRLHGESSWLRIVIYALAFSLGLALGFSALLPYPMPMLLPAPGAG